MGTKHLIAVVKDDEYKVAQYGQWDGYPEGQGLKVLNFLKENDIDKFRNQVAKCKFIEDDTFYEKIYKELDINPKDGFITYEDVNVLKDKYPQLGSDILNYIMNNDDIILKNDIDFAKDSLFCEWAYVIDLDKNTFEVYKGFNKSPLSESERFYNSSIFENGYYPIRQVISFDLNSLPLKEKFLSYFDK
jgi:hypothetical protein